MRRRKNITTWVALNSASKYIPHMLNCLENLCNEIKNQEKTDLVHSMNVLTFDVFSEMLFGDDVKEIITKPYPYENPNGEIEMIPLREILIRITKCYLNHVFNPLTHMFTFIKDNALVNPFKRDKKNGDVFKKAISEIVTNSLQKRVASKIYDDEICTEQQKIDDICGLMLAGSETTSHSLVSCLYFLNKYPETLKKLRKELSDHGFTKGENFEKS